MTSGIYLIINMFNKRQYVGSAKNLLKRFNEHETKLNKQKHPNKFLQNDWNKCGKNNFKFIILEYVDLENLLKEEQKWLNVLYDEQNMCYNICPTAGNHLGMKHTNETKQKMSLAAKGKLKSEEHKKKLSEIKKNDNRNHFKSGENNPMYGKTGNNHPNFGKQHSEETIIKCRNTNKNKQVGQYTKDGELIAIYKSQQEAMRITGIKSHNISAVCLNKPRYKTAGGFVWKFIF